MMLPPVAWHVVGDACSRSPYRLAAVGARDRDAVHVVALVGHDEVEVADVAVCRSVPNWSMS